MFIVQGIPIEFNKQKKKYILIKEKEFRKFFTDGCYEQKRANVRKRRTSVSFMRFSSTLPFYLHFYVSIMFQFVALRVSKPFSRS